VIDVVRFDHARLRPMSAHLGTAQFLGDWAVEDPGCFAGFIEFDRDIEVHAPIPHHEVQFVLSGRAEYAFTSYPDHQTERAVVVVAGDLLHIAFATMIRWRIIERPFRVAFAVMPHPPVPYRRD
jgi:hypothetical protein